MGLLARLLAPRPRAEPAPEARYSGTWAGDGWGAAMALGGRAPMAPHLAEGLAAVLGCVELISGSIASLPASLLQDAPDGQIPAPATATGWGLLLRPNVRQSWPACMAFLTASMLLHGNSVSYLRRDGRGAVVELVPIPWPWLALQLIQGAAGPRLAYDVIGTTPEVALLGLPRRMLDSDVLHLRARSDEGIIGRSVLSRAAAVVTEGTELARTSAALFANGLSMSGFVQTGGAVLTDIQRDRFKASLADLRGPSNAGKTMLLEGPFTYNPLSIKPSDAELLSSRQFSVGEIARLFCVPEPLLATNQRAVGNLDPFLSAFAQLALAPVVNAIETEFDHAILPPGLHLQLDMGGLLRGNFSGQMAAFGVGVQSGFLTPNDARRGLGLPTHPGAGGDELRPNGAAPSWPADAQGVPSLGPKPGRTGAAGLPNVGTNENEGQGAGP